jgi:predicted Rossmann fold nucleotide-binding protein DprA/Smf involved in DNA uptake
MRTSGSLMNFLEAEMDSNEYFGTMAGRVWNALSKGPRTLTQLQKVTGLTLKEVGMGLGWLAKEGKIRPVNPGSVRGKFELRE